VGLLRGEGDLFANLHGAVVIGYAVENKFHTLVSLTKTGQQARCNHIEVTYPRANCQQISTGRASPRERDRRG
jgi:hypothetical protein